MKFTTFASSSAGNAYIVWEEDTIILIDCGISYRNIIQNLSKLNLNIDDVSAILITHEHHDHTRGLKTLYKKHDIPLFLAKNVKKKIDFNCKVYKTFTPNDTWNIGTFNIQSFKTSHDATNPVGYRINSKYGSLGILTDTGYVTKDAYNTLIGVNTLLLEANHDVQMLIRGSYPIYLTQRIHSEFGHLSNEDAGIFTLEMVKQGTKEIILAHLSKENNDPFLALNTIKQILMSNNYNIPISVAPKDTMSKIYDCDNKKLL